MPNVDLLGTTLHYEIDGSGPAMLVLHGGLGLDHTLYRRSLAPLADSMQLVFVDQRGNGRSGRPDRTTITMEQLADDAVALADHLGLPTFRVLGHSYGGFVAQELALRHPGRVERLVLVATTPGQLGSGESEADTEPGPPMPDDLLAIFASPPTSDEEMRAGTEATMAFYLHRAPPAEVEPLHAGTVYSADAMARGFEVLAGWSSVDRLGSITCPTLLLVGRHDLFTSWPQSHRIASRLPDAEVVVFEHSGHMPWLDEPDEFFAVLRGWLGR